MNTESKAIDKEFYETTSANIEASQRFNLMKHCTIDWNEFKDKDVIDIGPAFGAFSDLAAYHGAKSIRAYEIDHKMVKKFEKVNHDHIQAGKIKIMHSDFLHTPIKPVDIVLFLAVLHHIEDWNKAIDKVFNTCKKGGTIYMELPIMGFTTYNYRPFLKRKKIWHYVPSLEEIMFQIHCRSGKIESFNEGFTYNHKRLFIKITKQ